MYIILSSKFCSIYIDLYYYSIYLNTEKLISIKK